MFYLMSLRGRNDPTAIFARANRRECGCSGATKSKFHARTTRPKTLIQYPPRISATEQNTTKYTLVGGMRANAYGHYVVDGSLVFPVIFHNCEFQNDLSVLIQIAHDVTTPAKRTFLKVAL